jgi:hypothetical protein
VALAGWSNGRSGRLRGLSSWLVARTEKWRDSMEEWHAEFAQVDVAKLSKPQVERLCAALAAAKARLDAVELGLGLAGRVVE